MKLLFKLFIIMCICLTSCAGMMSTKESDEVLPYQKTFVEHSQGRYSLNQVRNIPIFINNYRTFSFKDKKWTDDDSTLGVCYPIGVITISKKWWYSNFDPRRREQIIFHELAHCLMHKNHTKPTTGGLGAVFENLMFDLKIWKKVKNLSDGCPASYMNPSLFDQIFMTPIAPESYRYYVTASCLDKHYKYYIDELFDRTNRDEYENGY